MLVLTGHLQFEAAPLLQDLNNAPIFGVKRDRTRRIEAFNAAWARLQSDAPGWPIELADQQFRDKDQSIYIFLKYAHPDGIVEFATTHAYPPQSPFILRDFGAYPD